MKKSPETSALDRALSLPCINRNNFSKNHQNAKALDTAPCLTQTKFSIFEKNQQMTGAEGKKALDLIKQKRILISCKKIKLIQQINHFFTRQHKCHWHFTNISLVT